MLASNLLLPIFTSSPKAGVLLLPNSPVYTIVEPNNAYLELTGTKASELRNKGLFEAFPKNIETQESEAVDHFQKSIEIVTKTGKSHTMEVIRYGIPLPDKNTFEERYWLLENTPIYDENNELALILHSVEDVTKKHQLINMEQKTQLILKNNRERYKSLFFHNPDAVYSFDLEGTFVEANQATAEICETTVQHLLKITFLPLIVEEDKERVYTNFIKATKGEVVNYNSGLLTTKGNRRIINITNMPIIVNGEIVGVYGIAKDITEKWISETALENNRLRTKQILDQSMDVICTVDENGIFEDVSKACLSIWGYSPEELLGKPFMDLVFEEDREKTALIAKNVMDGLQTTDFHNRYKHKEGHLVPMVWSAKWDSQNNIMFGVARDATENLLNKQSLEESERKYKFLFENNPAAMLIWDFNTFQILDCNEMSSEIYGYEKNAFMDLTVGDIRPSDQMTKLEQIKETLTEDGAIHDLICLHQKKDGKLFHAKVNGRLTNLNGKQVVIIQVEDVTESQRAKERLKEERNLLRTLIDNLPDTIYFKDTDARKVISNKTDYTLIGATNEEEVLGKTDLEIFDERLANIGYRHDMEILKTGNGIYNYEEFFEKENRDPLWLSSTKLPIKNDHNEVIGLLGIGRDITLQKLADQKLKQLNLELENHVKKLTKSNNELERFAYVASHDLQEPLRAITTFLTLLDLRYKNEFDDKGRKYLNFAVESSLHLRQLILDLLNLSKIDNDAVITEEVDIKELIDSVIKKEKIILTGKNTTFTIDPMPTIRGNKSNIYQIFSNLISNSLKYCQDDKPLEIKLSVESLKNHWQFSVSDNGIGMEPEYFEKIFVVFQRLHGREKYSGTGIGLAIVKKIVENLGGKIWVESTVGKGSTFKFTIKK